MKLSKTTLLAAVALTFGGCALDDALNTTGSVIDSITGTANDAMGSTKTYKYPTLTITSPSQLEDFCHTRHKVDRYVVKSLPPMKYVTTENGGNTGVLQVMGTKRSEVFLQEDISGRLRAYANPVEEYDRANPDKIIKLKRPVYLYSDTSMSKLGSFSSAGLSGCEIEFEIIP